MANSASARKRVRTDKVKRARNKYQHKTARTCVKSVLKTREKQEGVDLVQKLKKAQSLLDKLVKRGIIHANKSARKKSQMAKHVHELLTP